MNEAHIEFQTIHRARVCPLFHMKKMPEGTKDPCEMKKSHAVSRCPVQTSHPFSAPAGCWLFIIELNHSDDPKASFSADQTKLS
jgi:hypothetical protein